MPSASSGSPRDRREPHAAPVPSASPELRTLALERTVHWEPVPDALSSLSVPLGAISAVEPLVVHQRALVDVEAHAAASRVLAFGILYGAVYRCPRLHLDYLLIEGVQRGSLDDVGANAELRSALGEMISRLHGSGVRAVGWYRSARGSGFGLSLADLGMHAALFPESWSIALVRDASAGRPTAAFLRLLDRRRPYIVPFYELLSPQPESGTDELQSAIAWSSYDTTAEIVEPDARDQRLPPFDAQTLRRATPNQPITSQRPLAGRARPFEPPRPTLEPVVEPPVEPPLEEAASDAPPRVEQSIERIFDEPAAPYPQASPFRRPPRRTVFRPFSFRPRFGARALAIMAIALAILVAWYATH